MITVQYNLLFMGIIYNEQKGVDLSVSCRFQLFMGIIYNEQKGDTPFWCISNSLL